MADFLRGAGRNRPRAAQIDGWFGFAAAYGFLCCAAMVLVAKGLGVFLKRPDNYYDD